MEWNLAILIYSDSMLIAKLLSFLAGDPLT
jgi:hypothetical protein